MKSKNLILVVGLMLGTLCAECQILIGPVIGTHVGWQRFDDSELRDRFTTEPIIGYHAGASLAFRVQKRFFLNTSIMYTKRGKILTDKVDNLLRNEATYHYIDMPILYTMEFKAKIGKDREYKWYLGIGPTVSYWLGGKGVFKNSDLEENTINPPNYELPYTITFGGDQDVAFGEMNIAKPNRFQFSLNFSAGIIFEPMYLNKIMLNLRYEIGHSFMSRDSKGDFGIPNVFYQDDLRIRNKMLALSLHYFIDLKTEDRKRGKSTSKITNKQRKRK